MIRSARLDDLPALLALEDRCFSTDRISRRQFRYLLTRAHAITLVDVGEAAAGARGAPRGYVLVLLNRGHSMARLYSIAVDPALRGHGVGRGLVEAVEQQARELECASMRLEVRPDNAGSLALFRSLGYEQFGTYDDYYEDHMGALRLEKSLAPHLEPSLARVPYYQQTTDFTCGPASLMMAMRALDPDFVLDRKLELRIWREATTIFMTSGHGGCGQHGLALAAAHRGFEVEVYLSGSRTFLVDSVRSEEKKEVMRLVQEDMEQELEALGVPVVEASLNVERLQQRFEAGAIPVVLISSFQIYGEKFPHWVVITGFDQHFVYAHDPFVDVEGGETTVDSIAVPIGKRQFERMARYGRAGVKAVLLLYPRAARSPRRSGRGRDVGRGHRRGTGAVRARSASAAAAPRPALPAR
ncbi:MAG: GNAT family N-acetyltransferase/peptidase C39 family protein [Burkholderiales bacterium]|nr:MAG: GNAT family N-acetyltransferase/peptidase C39 family protein [Burkholderiales bacterium]